MRFRTFLALLFLVGCGANEVSQVENKAALSQEPKTAEASEPEAEPDPEPSTGPWADMHKKYGENLFGVKKTELSAVSYNVTRRELVLQFDFPMVLEGHMLSPSKVLDHEALREQLGATKVGEVPSEFMMLCGENHGGDFEVGGVKYGIYVSGGCHQIRIFDPTPDAIKLLVGADFVGFFHLCSSFKFGPVCRSETTVRLKASDEPKMSFLVFDGFKAQHPKMTIDGWLEVELPERARGRELESFIYAAGSVRCDMELPALSPMEVCGLTGGPYVPKVSKEVR